MTYRPAHVKSLAPCTALLQFRGAKARGKDAPMSLPVLGKPLELQLGGAVELRHPSTPIVQIDPAVDWGESDDCRDVA